MQFQQLLMASSLGGGVATVRTWNPSDKSASIVLTNGNLTATQSGVSGPYGVRGTTSKTSGKYYFEVTVVTIASLFPSIGVADATHVLTTNLGTVDAVSAGYRASGLLQANSGVTGIAATALANNDVVGVAVDITNHLIYWAKNNTWQNSANPSAGTGGIDYITTAAVFPAMSCNADTGSVTVNLGATAFTYTAPSGFTSGW